LRYSSVVDLIGNTPLLDVSALSPNPNVSMHVKLEGYNPGGSVKDRIARSMVLAAEQDGSLEPGQVIIESSSGNTGIGLALVSRARGYKLKIVLPENVSPERRDLL
jgi:cysteine synthase B